MSTSYQDRVWFITGCSSGFGKILAEELLQEGYRVAATARNLESLEVLKKKAPKPDQLLCLRLDVTRDNHIHAAVTEAIKVFGHIDVLVNNAGYGILGAHEEVNAQEIFKIFDTNVFGLFEVTRAILPFMRKQKSGHIINISSIGGLVSSPALGIYNATKFAVEGHSEALAQEVAPFGIKVTIVEPGPFRTNFLSSSLVTAPEMSEYDEAIGKVRAHYHSLEGKQTGDPVKAAKAIITIAETETPPLRLLLGKIAYSRIEQKMETLSKELKAWEKLGKETDF